MRTRFETDAAVLAAVEVDHCDGWICGDCECVVRVDGSWSMVDDPPGDLAPTYCGIVGPHEAGDGKPSCPECERLSVIAEAQACPNCGAK